MVVNNCQLNIPWLKMYFNYDLRTLNVWINRNIVLCLGDIVERTFDVRVRIATSMLFKCIGLTDDEKRQIHSDFVTKMRREFYSVVDEQLPFQQIGHWVGLFVLIRNPSYTAVTA